MYFSPTEILGLNAVTYCSCLRPSSSPLRESRCYQGGNPEDCGVRLACRVRGRYSAWAYHARHGGGDIFDMCVPLKHLFDIYEEEPTWFGMLQKKQRSALISS